MPHRLGITSLLDMLMITVPLGLALFLRELGHEINGPEVDGHRPGVVFVFGRRVNWYRLVLRLLVLLSSTTVGAWTMGALVVAMGHLIDKDLLILEPLAMGLGGMAGWRVADAVLTEFWVRLGQILASYRKD